MRKVFPFSLMSCLVLKNLNTTHTVFCFLFFLWSNKSSVNCYCYCIFQQSNNAKTVKGNLTGGNKIKIGSTVCSMLVFFQYLFSSMTPNIKRNHEWHQLKCLSWEGKRHDGSPRQGDDEPPQPGTMQVRAAGTTSTHENIFVHEKHII